MSTPYKEWNSYTLFFSAEYSQSYLKKCYRKNNIDQPDIKSFENCYPFMYYLEHGKLYYEQAEKSPLTIQPILLFYGLVHLIKACILTVEPDYPETTSVLAHGVSTRKRKKQQYSFTEDEVKFQKNGLFSLMAEKMFHMKQLEGEKATMGDVLELIPELSGIYSDLRGKQIFEVVTSVESGFSLPKSIIDHFHMTENRFKEFFQSKSSIPVSFVDDPSLIRFEANLDDSLEPLPLKYNLEDLHYVLPLNKGDLFLFPELLLHYLLLYNLGMIARYETEWWSELIKMMPNEDYPLIQSFLSSTMKKGPYLIYQYLMNK
ncbi:YaaC family protein [Mesobacillus subterraneus]|uniref:YaaC family protein n=1 Tax=Mesobacillus subterraneus TaxID=285983 RepID=UPI00273F7FB0|nr:YaaC family protein [Mesobacillus subterraneus]WLR55128.1 YaaC family protein [Mesobacillus subterraneus]